jgi:hypothetical protein
MEQHGRARIALTAVVFALLAAGAAASGIALALGEGSTKISRFLVVVLAGGAAVAFAYVAWILVRALLARGSGSAA